MEMNIKGTSKEIAVLVNLLQGRPLEDAYCKSGPANKVLTVDDLPSSTFD